MKKTYFSLEDATCYLLQGQDFMFSTIRKQKKEHSAEPVEKLEM
jgi:hypothetical protein